MKKDQIRRHSFDRARNVGDHFFLFIHRSKEIDNIRKYFVLSKTNAAYIREFWNKYALVPLYLSLTVIDLGRFKKDVSYLHRNMVEKLISSTS